MDVPKPISIPLEDKIRLRCVKEGNRLRVKILSKGFSHDANCQFPKDIRVEGREFFVPRSDISMAETKGKFFYRVKKSNIEICPAKNVPEQKFDLSNLKIYEDPELEECVVCMDDKDKVVGFIILVKCGHACVCKKCSDKLKECPMCRAPISQKITKDQLQ